MSLVASLVNSLQRPLLLGSLPCLTLSPRVWPGSDDLTSWINMRRLQRYIDRSFWSVRMIYGYKSPISQSNANVRCCRVGLIQMTLKSLISWQVSEGTLFDWGEWGSTSWKTPDTAEASWRRATPPETRSSPCTQETQPAFSGAQPCRPPHYWLSPQRARALANALSTSSRKKVRQKTQFCHIQNCGIKLCQPSWQESLIN